MTDTEIEVVHIYLKQAVPPECELVSIRTLPNVLQAGKNNPGFLTEVLVKNKTTDKQLLTKFNSKKLLRQITKEAKYGKHPNQFAR